MHTEPTLLINLCFIVTIFYRQNWTIDSLQIVQFIRLFISESNFNLLNKTFKVINDNIMIDKTMVFLIL